MAHLLASPAVRQIVARLNKTETEEQVKKMAPKISKIKYLKSQ
jgi:hypothetical protein